MTGIQLAMRAELDQSYLSKLEKGKAGFSEEGLKKIARGLGVPLSELFGSNNVEFVVETFQNRVPILNYVQAGSPAEVAANFAEDEFAGFATVDLENVEGVFGLVIRGDSMTPDFTEGDLIIIKRDLEPRPGDFVIAYVGGMDEAAFKRFRIVKTNSEGKVVFALVPLNGDYPTLRSDETEIVVRGTMIEHRRFRRR